MSSNPVSKPLLDRVSACTRKHRLLEEGNQIIVAVSGGSDSLALLHLLHHLKLRLQLVAVYVDHGLRPEETLLEEQNIQYWCSRLNVPLFIERVDVIKYSAETGRSVEDSARRLRYEVLEKKRCEKNGQAIAVGHTADDQVEEFFIRLVRGSGTRGLSGMEPRNGYVIRPLLFERKETLERFLTELGVTWNVDSSNRDRRFLRNRVRLDLLPLLEKTFNPAIRKRVLRNMDILQKEDHFLEQEARAAYKKIVTHEKVCSPDRDQTHLTVNTQHFRALHPALARRVMEKCCWRMGSRPTYVHIRSLIALASAGDNCGELHLGGGLRAVRESGTVTFLYPLKDGRRRGSAPPLPSVRLPVAAVGNYQVPEINRELIVRQHPSGVHQPVDKNVLRVDMDRITFPLLLRSARPGERFHPCNGPGKKKISRYFNDRKIPARQRPTYPVLLCKDRIVAVAGLQIDHHFRVRDTTENVLLISWQIPENT